MPFMTLHAQFGKWWRHTDANGDGFVIDGSTSVEGRAGTIEFLGAGWCARLSAPGYLDCTEWSGPFPTEDLALAAAAEANDVCPHCSDQCSDDDESTCGPGMLDSIRDTVRSMVDQPPQASPETRAANRALYQAELALLMERAAALDDAATDDPAAFCAKLARAVRLGVEKGVDR